jgi:hypothetical protein
MERDRMIQLNQQQMVTFVVIPQTQHNNFRWSAEGIKEGYGRLTSREKAFGLLGFLLVICSVTTLVIVICFGHTFYFFPVGGFGIITGAGLVIRIFNRMRQVESSGCGLAAPAAVPMTVLPPPAGATVVYGPHNVGAPPPSYDNVCNEHLLANTTQR